LATVRRLLTELLADAGVPDQRRHDALLVAHEVVANAIAHGSRQGDEIELRCTLQRGRLEIVVFDSARSPSVPVALTPAEERASGRGLQVVDRLCDAWNEILVEGRRRVTVQMSL
jgi:anti-sigma regulatory factor (Ser/Thr protein kinase)